MKKLLNMCLIVTFISSCAGIKKRGHTPDEILKNRIMDYNLDKRFLLSITNANTFKKKFPTSKYRVEVEYIKGKVFEQQERYEEAYAHWIDFSKIYPKFKTEKIKQRISDLKNKRSPLKALSFFELSYANEFAKNGNIDRLQSKGYAGFNLAYYAHRPGKYVHGFFWSYSRYNFNNITFPREQSPLKHDIAVKSLTLGYSFKAELKKDIIQSIISLGPALNRYILYTDDKILSDENDKSIGLDLNFRASIDYKFYENKNSISGNGKFL